MRLPEECKIEGADYEHLESIFQLVLSSYAGLLGLDSFEPIIKYDREAYGPHYKFLSLENLRSWFRSGGREQVFVAVCGDSVIGVVIFGVMGGGEGYVEEIHVSPEYRGKGIGAALLRSAERALTSRGVGRVLLEAHEGAIGFFEKMGYKVLAEVGLYMGKLRYYLLEKVISPSHAPRATETGKAIQ
ncbi:MAG: GNAT family N-acetyltransferase [Desulfurococcales archaeon]|nr:GNAT family N-acetyltransferase [Desulfurococcales archaeon]